MKNVLQWFRLYDRTISEILERMGLLLIRIAGFVWLVEIIYHKVMGH